MKNKFLLSLIGTGLLLSSCGGENASSKNSSSSSTPSVSTSSKAPEISSSKINSSTVIESYYSDSDLNILNKYFDFEIPGVNLDYVLTDFTDTLGATYVSIEFYEANQTDFNELKAKLENAFSYEGEEDYEGLTWYAYSKDDYYIDLCYDEFTYEVPCLYLEIYASELLDSEGEEGEEEIKEAVNGYFDESDKALLNSMFNFDIPFIGDYYELYDYTSVMGYEYVIIYFDYVSSSDFDSLLSVATSQFTFDGTEDYEGLTYYMFSIGNYYVDIAFDENGYDYPYIVMTVYFGSGENNGGTTEGPSGTETEIVDGLFESSDAAWLMSKFGFVIPVVGETYELLDYTEYVGMDYALVYFNHVEENEFTSYINALKAAYTYDGTEEYEGLTYYLFSVGEYCIDVAYDAEGYDYPYVVIDIYYAGSESDGDNGNTGNDSTQYEGTQVVDGSFTSSDKSFLNSAVGFVIPVIGDYYEIYDYTNEYGMIVIYFNYISSSDFNTYINTLDSLYASDGTEVDEGLTYYLYSYGDYYIDVAYDATGYDYPYIAVYIYAAE